MIQWSHYDWTAHSRVCTNLDLASNERAVELVDEIEERLKGAGAVAERMI